MLNRERRTIAALLPLFWLVFQLIYFIYFVLRDIEHELGAPELLGEFLHYVTSPSEFIIISSGALMCLGVYGILTRVRGWRLSKQLLVSLTAALACAAAFSIVVSVVCEWFGFPWPKVSFRFVIMDSMRWFPAFGLWSGIALAVTYNSTMREREHQIALIEAQARDAQLQALRYQVNPHLLYNTLNSIAALILDGQNEVAEAMLMRFSEYFRASLSSDPQADVTLADEVKFQRLYLDIERMRFPDKLSSEVDIPPELQDVPVPSMILQPLVENAVKHGVTPNGAPTHLRIAGRRDGDQLTIEVSDNGAGTSSTRGTGVGLKNVRSRLKSRFGDRASLTASSQPGSGFLVRLTIPIQAA